MEIPKNLLYTEDHEWVKIENDIAYIGITDFAQRDALESKFELVEKKVNQLKASVAVYRALGGGWDQNLPASSDVTSH